MIVTVVTPTLNAVTYLDECIKSVQSQAGANVTVEHIIVDGGSTDGTVELARSLGVTVLEGADSGLYDADNKGAAASSGELLGFLGADDLLLPGALEAVVRRYEKDRLPWLAGAFRWIDADGNSLGEFAAPPRWLSSRMLAGLQWCYIHQMATYVTRDLFDEIGGFDTTFKISGDYDFFCKALAAAPWSRMTEQIACFRRHGANMSMSSAARSGDEYRIIRDRHAAKSRLVREFDHQLVRLQVNARNPSWAIRKQVDRFRAARQKAPADASTEK